MRDSSFACALAVAFAGMAVAFCGCASMPRIDPTGERILTWEAQGVSVPATPGIVAPAVAAPGLTLTPTRIVAPVGSEVLMVAGVHGPGQPNLPGRRVEWMLSPGSVGQLLAVGESDQPRLFRFGTPPQKVSNDYAVSETQSTARIITRGTADPRDDVSVLPGQAWVTVSSPVEGASYVTAFAPEIQGVPSNRQSAVIHWVDLRWIAPVSAATAIGQAIPLTTTVTRATTGAPLPGYKVRYEVAGGAEAGFGPTLSGGVELTTNEEGRATAELIAGPSQSAAVEVHVELIRPAGITAGTAEPVVLGSTTITAAWRDLARDVPGPLTPGAETAPAVVPAAPPGASGAPPASGSARGQPVVDVRVVSPSQPVAVGGEAEFEIHITNRGAATLKNVTVLDRFGDGLSHAVAPSPIKRSIGDLAAGQTRSIGLTFTVRQPGRQCHTVEVTADGGAKTVAEGCATAVAGEANTARPSVSLKQSGPRFMKAGETALVKIEITNTGTKALTNLRLIDTWRGGLQPVRATDGNQRTGENELTWQYRGPLAVGEKAVFEVEYRATAAGPGSCSRAAVTGDDVSAEDELCMEITGVAPTATQNKLSVIVSDRIDPVPAGTPFSYRIVVRNDGNTPQRDVVLTVELPDSLNVDQVQAPVKDSKLDERPMRFAPIRSLEPGKLVSYELRLTAARAGKVVVRASATSQSILEASTAEQDTTILPAQ